MYPLGNPNLKDDYDNNESFSSGGRARSFERVIKPQVNEYSLGWTSEFSRRKDESSFNFGLDLNILNILDFLDDSVDDEVDESWMGNDANENMDVPHGNAPDDPTVFYNVPSLYEDPWNATISNDGYVLSPRPQDNNPYKNQDMSGDKSI